MARPSDTIVPFPGRLGRHEAPRARSRRSRGSRRRRSRVWLLPLMPLLYGAVWAVLHLESGQDTGLRTASAVGEADTFGGPARVIDGDTLRIGDARIRVYGIDAPESAQTCRRDGRPWNCGAAATAHLERLVGGRGVTCEDRGTDRYSRTLALCRAGGADIGAAMVRAGHASAHTDFSERYLPEERQARAARRGIWSGDLDAPSLWRWGS